MATIERAIPAGGAALNFAVVGGTVQPINPKENTIWVNTAAEITGWAFSATEPTDPTAGMVWVQTKDSSAISFNALKKNTIIVQPAVIQQYNNGAWEKKTASLYKDGVWQTVKADFYVIPNLAEFPSSAWAADGGSLTFNANGTMSVAASGYTVYHRYLLTPIDLTNYSTIRYVSTCTGSFHNYFGISQSPRTTNQNWTAKAGGAAGTYTLDVSGLTGEWYLAAYTSAGGGSGTWTIKEWEVLM